MAAAAPNILREPLPSIRKTLLAHYKRLGGESRLRRFMTPANDENLRRLTRATSPDLVIGIRKDDEIRGVLELFDLKNGHAEIGISVEDAYQGRGFGRALIHAGIGEARERDFESVDLYFSAANSAMRNLCLAYGAEIRNLQAECIAFIDL